MVDEIGTKVTDDPVSEVEEVARPPLPMPGKQLREARERLKLSIDDIAVKTHLDPQLVRALEADDYKRFSAPIYVSGHMRNYARVLNIDPEPLIEAYERLGEELPPILSELSSNIAKKKRKIEIENLAGYLISGGVIILLLVWFVLRPSTDSTPQETPSSGGFQTQLDGQASAGGEISPANEPSTDEPGPSDVSTEIAEPAPPEFSDVLVLKFSAESWVEITDITGRQLFYAMGKPGQQVTLDGVAPFSLLLGYSPGVAIEYNGNPIDPAPFSRKDVARFKIGEEFN